MSKLLRSLLARFLTLGVGEEGDPPEVEAAPEAEAPEAGLPEIESDTLDDLIAATPPEDPTERLTAAERRAEQAERELAAERSRPREPVAPVRGDPEYEREEAELAQARASGASAETLAWVQWKIDSNRKMRASERNSQSALQEARDLADRAEFGRLETSKPKLYKAYADKIEKTIADLRAKGQSAPPRKALLAFFIGDDMMNGKIKAKTTKPAAEGGAKVERTRIPNARGDVRATGGNSERE